MLDRDVGLLQRADPAVGMLEVTQMKTILEVRLSRLHHLHVHQLLQCKVWYFL